LSKIWQKFGAPYSGCLKAAKALEDAGLSLSSLRVGDVIELIVGDENDIVEFRKKFSDGRTLILQGGAESGYEGQVIVPEVVEDERVVMGTINQSFSQVALEHNVPYSVVDQLVDIMGSRVEFRRDLQPGDDFALIYTERRLRDDPEHLLEPGPVSAASLTVGGKQLVAIRHVGKDGVGRYFDREGNPLDRFFLRYPLNFTRISSMFSKSRFHPVLKINRPHNGVDFAAPIGTPVRAVAGGRVTFAGWKGAAGRMIKVQHDGRYS
ncbi:MAG: peptidoglycan DD-metalloendopeptidase family protein, partial [Bdellovibrionales bacterium]|nr:peptidoglycan DD-metalloendopeptidase family protein [Bdellovibrionales bacterium]